MSFYREIERFGGYGIAQRSSFRLCQALNSHQGHSAVEVRRRFIMSRELNSHISESHLITHKVSLTK